MAVSLKEVNEKLGSDKLTQLQFNFCVLFAETGNGMRSIREAGFNHRTPGSQSSAAHRLLRKDKVKIALRFLKKRAKAA